MHCAIVIATVLLFFNSTNGLFDDQPKFLTEDGNFIIESAMNRNISFRLRGNGCLKVNDRNIMNMARQTDTNVSPRLMRRITSLENRLNQVNTRPMPRGLAMRVTRLENQLRITNGTGNLTGSDSGFLSTRLSVLEQSVQNIVNQLNADNCANTPCKNGGTCWNSYGKFICNCPIAWTGRTCEEDVNECENFANTNLGCQNGGTCTNGYGSYTCACLPGWHGLHCTSRTVDCLTSGQELCGHGVCVQTSDVLGYRCICDQGWTNNNRTPECTVDIDECTSPIPHCSMDPEVMCVNLPGSYACGRCPSGYSGSGHYCRDINECEINNGGCSVAPRVPCINTRGSFRCGNCPVGYRGDGFTCARIWNSVDLCGQIVCHPQAICVTSLMGPSCVCNPGLVGTGIGPRGCLPRNGTFTACSPNPCLNGGLCILQGLNSFMCVCPSGTMRPLCTRPNSCDSNPCMNGGTCVGSSMSENGYQCRCRSNYSGLRCQTPIRSCSGLRSGMNGTLKYPSDGNYPENISCVWLLSTNLTKVLNVTFTRFDLEQSRECRFDWLQIHDGRSSVAHSIGRFCGNQLPKNGNIISTQNVLYLWFRSDNSTSHGGFELNWNSIDPICGGDIEVASHGTIVSPGSPGNYPPNRDCIWHLTASSGRRIQFHFLTMQLEQHVDCQYDYLAIHDGESTDENVIEKFCNTSHPEPLTSPSNEVTLHFHSDADQNDAGFQIHYTVIEGIPGCGGVYTTESGEFGSPGEQYAHNLNCHYLIRLPKDSRIKLHFESFSLEEGPDCMFDYIEIFDGSRDTDPKFGRWCSSNVPPDTISTANAMLIVFKTDFSGNRAGFKAKYEIACGGKFEDPNGIIMSPLYPNNYKESRQCEFYIEAPTGKGIKLDFQDFDLEDTSSSCEYDYLDIYDGTINADTKIGRYCGTSRPEQIVSRLNYLHLVLVTDDSISGRGFKGNYTFFDVGCGGVIRSINQTIQPSMKEGNNAYAGSQNCRWIIEAPKDKLILLTFTTFELEDDSTCTFDSLTIYDGYVTSSDTARTAIGKYCGRNKPPIIRSNGNVLTIVFKTDDSLEYGGYSFTYEFIDGRNVCGGNLFSSTGTIKSPNYPHSYQPDLNCEWIIHAQDGKQIELIVKNFEIESSYSSGCVYDILEIRNGGTDTSPLIDRFCGTTITQRIKSFGNLMYIKFTTDSSREMNGFEIQYDATISGCGGIIKNTMRGSITSPNYPNNYALNMQCDWKVIVSAGSTIKITFSDMDMEEHDDCTFDYLEIFDGSDGSAKSLGKYCSSDGAPAVIHSTSNVLSFRMVSDFSQSGRGFEIRFDTNCTRVIDSSRGIIESPNFPSHYPDNLNCEWRIIPKPSHKIFVEFSSFALESSDSCAYDFLKIDELDINDNSSIKTSEHCSEMPKSFKTENIIVFTFKTDFSNGDTGFHLEFESEGCSAYLTKPSGTFQTPNYPNPYPHNTQCIWKIEVPYGNLIEVTIHDFDFEAMPSCAEDGLIFSNEENSSDIISKNCGSKQNASNIITSQTNILYVKFYSDASYAGRGFDAIYRMVPIKCGGTYQTLSGQIQSPNYPRNYPAQSFCEYLIRTEATHTLELKFKDVDLEITSQCRDDYIQIYNGNKVDQSNVLLERICGPINNTIVSKTNEMLVVFRSDYQIEAKGFVAEFETRCGGTINATGSGILEVGHNLRWRIKECEWIITAAKPDQHVAFDIIHLENDLLFKRLFENDTENNCLRKLSIYDGSASNRTLLKEICSSKHPARIISNGDSLTIKLAPYPSDMDMAYIFDMKAYYTVIDNECGGEFSSLSGEIASPQYPNSYPNNIECEWKIKASPGNKMSITVEILDINSNTDSACNQDYLEFREDNNSGKLLGVYCDKTSRPTLQSNAIWMKFRSDNNNVGQGFLLSYNYLNLVEHTGTNGIITSPLYPQFIYTADDPYEYRITVENKHRILLTFSNDLNVKREASITIYDGYDDRSPIIREITGYERNIESFESTTNNIFISFSIMILSETKFKINWNQISGPYVEEKNTTNSLNCTSNSVIELGPSENVHIESPGFPNGYDENLNCKWTFLSKVAGYHIAMAFVNLDLEVTDSCLSDYVLVESSTDLVQFNNLTKSCTPIPGLRRLFYHGTPNLRVNFISDFFTNRTGFEAIIFSVCGGLLPGPNGEIPQRNQTLPPQLPLTCNWTITVQRGRKIKFTIEQLTFPSQNNEHCEAYFLFRDGLTDDSPFVGSGKFCSNISDQTITTSGNKAFIQFDSGIMLSKPTYKIKYEQLEPDCGGFTILSTSETSKVIATPNYPDIPHPYSECIWKIIAPNGELLRIDSIDRFDLVQTTNCLGEYVEFREGSTAYSPLIQDKICGKTFTPIFTGSNSLRIHYYTDVAVPNNGFKLNISFAQCGRSIVGNSGQIQSSGYPNGYAASTTCEYHIMGAVGTNLNLTFLDLDLPYSFSDCNATDHLDIYTVWKNADGIDTLDKIKTVCGRGQQDSIIAEQNRVLIKFVSTGNSNNRRGFRIQFGSIGRACRYELNAPRGEFTSPSYPQGRNLDRICEWLITTPKGTRVVAEIDDFDIAARQDVIHRGVTFFNDFSNLNRIETINSANATGQIIRSSDNKMFIRAFIMRNEGHRGFKISYRSDEETICVGNFNDDEGFIESPNTNEPYYCEYSRNENRRIATNGTGTLGIRVEIILINGTNCTRGIHTGVDIMYGVGIRKPLFNRCPPKYANIAAPSTSVKIVARSVARYSPNKFKSRFTYKMHRCGGIIESTLPRINITEPTVGPNYGEIDCAWTFNAENSHQMNLLLSLSQGDCENEYINVYNGLTPATPLIRKLCGESATQNISISSSHLFFEYHNSNFTSTSKLTISIEPFDGECGGIISAPNFIIPSPKNGTKYPFNSFCEWTINSQPGFRIHLTFVERFMLESSTNCSKDYIEIYDFMPNETVASKQWKSLGRKCGRDTPSALNSTSTSMKIVFRSDGDIDGDGFTMQWSQICGGLFMATKDKQFIVSPRYPDKYAPNLNCNYSIYGSNEQPITIKFLDFDLEDTSIACQFDNVTIYKPSYMYSYSSNKELSEIGTYCSSTAMDTFRGYYQMIVVFRTDSWYEKRGFKFSYVLDECGGTITSSQIIGSTNEEGTNYIPNMNCLWNITAPADKLIIIRFELFELEHDSGCWMDSVEVYEGSKIDEKKRKVKLCGNMTGIIPSIHIPLNRALVKFVSDTSSEYKGFRALILFQTNCDQTFNLSTSNPLIRLDKTFTEYPALLDCHFSFQVPIGNLIQVKFSQLHLAPCSRENGTGINGDPCSCDFLNIRDGFNPFSDSIGTYCGHDTPNDILSSGNTLWMRFATDSVGFSTGFILTAQMVPSPCGSPIRRLDKDHSMLVLESPNDGRNYLPNLNCYWDIQSPDDMVLDLKFEKLIIEGPDSATKQCTADFLEIKETTSRYIAEGLGENIVYAGEGQTSSLYYYGRAWPSATHTYCGDAHPIDYFSNGNNITVHFKSNAEIEKSGFKLVIKELNACERNYTHSQGRILGTKSLGCELFISTPSNTSISLYFSTFDFDLFTLQSPSFVCTEENAHMTVYDANKNQILQKLCGTTLPNPIFTNSNFVKLKFNSEPSYSSTMVRYDITYIASNNSRGCGGEVFNYAGTFTSPGYPNTERNDSDCSWTINVPQHLVVQLDFDVFDLGPKQLCGDNFLDVIETDSTRRFCGSDLISTFQTKTNVVIIRFKSGRNFAGSGWILVFKAAFGGEFI